MSNPLALPNSHSRAKNIFPDEMLVIFPHDLNIPRVDSNILRRRDWDICLIQVNLWGDIFLFTHMVYLGLICKAMFK